LLPADLSAANSGFPFARRILPVSSAKPKHEMENRNGKSGVLSASGQASIKRLG
jgi:hypothetical protein